MPTLESLVLMASYLIYLNSPALQLNLAVL